MKKKILSLILSATLIFSVFSLTAFAQEKTRAETWIENYTNEIHFKTITNFDNEEIVFEMYIKNNKLLIKNTPVENFVKADVLYDGESFYIYPSNFPFIHLKFNDESYYNPAEDIMISSLLYDLYFVKSYTKTIGSKEYYVEAYSKFEDYNEYHHLTEFVFDGDNLVYMLDDDLKVEFISTQIDDSVFNPPFFSINLTAIFEAFANILGLQQII